MTREQINDLSYQIIGAAIEVHKILGPGLLEKAYEAALVHELKLRGLNAVNQVPIPFEYKGIELDLTYKADIIVEDTVIVELKASEKNDSVFSKQLQTYLKLSDKRLGLLINFNYDVLKDGIKREVNQL